MWDGDEWGGDLGNFTVVDRSDRFLKGGNIFFGVRLGSDKLGGG